MADTLPAASAELATKIKKLQGPILVLGASGFVGANLFRQLLSQRNDVVGTASRTPAWRLEGIDSKNVAIVDLLVDSNLDALLAQVNPRTVFNCVAYGAYSFETEPQLIYQTNFNFTARLLARLAKSKIACYIHAGSSSEYGDNATAPAENELTAPNSDYAVSKVAAANLIYFYGKRKSLPCANLRLYSIYGPLEDSSRLIPTLVRFGVDGKYPEFVNPEVSRDFVYIYDTCEAFVDAALNLRDKDHGESFNIGSGRKTTIRDVALLAQNLFKISEAPVFTMPNRQWDVTEWYSKPDKARERLEWSARTDFREGMHRTIEWYRSLPDKKRYEQSSKKYGLDTKHSVSAVVACHNHARTIPLVYERLRSVFGEMNIDFEIIFVDNCSGDGSDEIIRGISRNDRRVVGIVHSRDFGPEAAYLSGMEIAGKNSCLLMMAGLNDPPELIEKFVAKWREGYDVVYGQRKPAGDSGASRLGRGIFYRIFNRFSYVRVPHDAGDFSLMDKRVVAAMLRFPERSLFLRGLRAYAGFHQTGVEYERVGSDPAQSGRHRIHALRRASGGLLSFSNVPLHLVSLCGFAMLLVSAVMACVQIALHVIYPQRAASGITTVIIVVLFFGSLNLFAVSVLGEYIGRVFEEVKRRPHFIRRTFIEDGEMRWAAEALDGGSRRGGAGRS